MYAPKIDNPNYLAYARAHGKAPEAMMEHDKGEYPGGCMCGFILWISKQKRGFYKVHPEAFIFNDRGSIDDMEAWEQWLQDQADIEAKLLAAGKPVDFHL